MKGFRIIIAIMLACCGLIEINLIISNYTSTVAWTLYFVIIIGVFLGIVQYKIGNNPLERANLSTGVILSFLIVNILYIGFVSQLLIQEMIEILTAGLLLTMITFEESTRFLLFNLKQKPDGEVNASKSVPMSVKEFLLLRRIESA